MKFNFKKISAVVTGVLLTGMTMGVAVSAANFPAQFTSSPAIVYGTNAQPGTDLVQAKNIQTYLESHGASVGSTGSATVTTVNSNESYKFERASTKLHLGDDLTTMRSSLTKTQLPKLLADGTYRDFNNNANQYTQKITIDSNSLTLYDMNSNQDPTLGFDIQDGVNILGYTLNFQDNPKWSNVDGSWLPFMGKNYYVLSHTNGTGGTDGTLTLLNFASSETYVNEGASKTVSVNGKSYTISATFIGTNKAVLSVNGNTLNSLSQGQSYELNDGSYVVVKDILASSKTGSVNQVGFVIGSNKLKIGAGNQVEVNSVSEPGLTSTITSTTSSTPTNIKSISLTWSANNEQFVTDNSSLTMPVFKTLTLSYTGLTNNNGNTFSVENSGSQKAILNNFPLTDGSSNLNLMYMDTSNGKYIGLGESATRPLMVTNGNTLTLNMSASHYPSFVASYNDGSGSESSYIMKFSTPTTATGGDETTLSYNSGNGWNTQTGVKTGTDISIGDVSFKVTGVYNGNKTVTINDSASPYVHVNFNTLYSKGGLAVHLPWINTTAVANVTTVGVSAADACSGTYGNLADYQLGYDANLTYNDTTGVNGDNTTICTSFPTSYNLQFTEATKDGNADGTGNNFNVTLGGYGSASPYKVSATDVSTENNEVEMGSNSQKYVSYVYGPHATKLVKNTNPNQNTVDITYNGGEVSAGVYLGATEATSTTTAGNSTVGSMIFTDSETSSYANMNVVVVGGSCINSAAAKLLGVPSGTCGSAFTASTGIGSGQYLIKGYSNSTGVGKSAILVAGYNADDTKNAVTYLTNNAVDVAKTYTGTSGTEATVKTTTA